MGLNFSKKSLKHLAQKMPELSCINYFSSIYIGTLCASNSTYEAQKLTLLLDHFHFDIPKLQINPKVSLIYLKKTTT